MNNSYKLISIIISQIMRFNNFDVRKLNYKIPAFNVNQRRQTFSLLDTIA